MYMMGSKAFQTVLDTVKLWHDQSFRDLLVNGRFAIEDDADRQWIRYAARYCSKPHVEFQARGLSHVSYLLVQRLTIDSAYTLPSLTTGENAAFPPPCSRVS